MMHHSPQPLVSLPMYAINPPDCEALWQRLAPLWLEQVAGPVPGALSWPRLLTAHWQSPHLLLSQTCGYPLMTVLPRVQVVGRFHYSVPGCEEGAYHSLIVTRADDLRQNLADFRAGSLAYNSLDSHSGYNVLRFMLAPLAQRGHFFRRAVQTGSHALSLAAVRKGDVDLASVDCITHALIARDKPEMLEGLRVLEATPSAPSLPLITAGSTSPAQVTALRRALATLVADPASREACGRLLIQGFTTAEREDYLEIMRMRQTADLLGVTTL